MRLLKSRPAIVLVVLLYTLAFFWGYTAWTYPTWNYMGFSYEWKGTSRFIAAILFCLLPMCWIPLRNTRPTMIIYWMLYAMTYIPMIIGVGFARQFSSSAVLVFWVCAAIGFGLNGIFYYFRKFQFPRRFVSKTVFFAVFFCLMLGLVLHVFLVYRDALSFVSPFDANLYDKRAEGVEAGQGSSAGYSIMWLAGGFCPFLLAYGIYYKKPLFGMFAALGLLFVYMTQADKAFLFSILWILLIYVIQKRTKYLGPVFTFLFALLLLFLAFANDVLKVSGQPLMFIFSGLVLVRLVGVSAYTSTIYYDFFDGSHPYTYYSHVSGINQFISYPYNDMIGKVVGASVINDPNFNANANYFITDGLIAIGPLGMILAGLVCGSVLYMLDSVSSRHNNKFVTLALTYNSVNIMNASIFTSVFSGGLLWIFIFIYFFNPRRKHQAVIPESSHQLSLI